MPYATEMKFFRGKLSHCLKIMPILLFFQHDNATSHTARDTVNFPRANNVAFINDWPAKSPDLHPIEYLWDNLDQRVRCRPIPPSNVIQLRQPLIPQTKIINLSVLLSNDARQSFMLKVVIPGINLGFW